MKAAAASGWPAASPASRASSDTVEFIFLDTRRTGWRDWAIPVRPRAVAQGMNPSRNKTISAVGAVGAAAAIGLAACGGGNSTADAAPSAAKAPAVAVKKISGTSVVAYRGHTLYSPTQEKHGDITCTGGCVKVWGVVKASAKKGSKVRQL